MKEKRDQNSNAIELDTKPQSLFIEIHRLNHNYKLRTTYNNNNENNIKSNLTKNEFVKKKKTS